MMTTFDGLSHKLVLARLIAKRGSTTVAEIGVKKGTTFLYLLQACPDVQLLGVDIWAGANAPYQDAIQQIIDMKYPQRGLLVRARSVEAATTIPDASLDLVFIDADHSEASVRADIVAWRRKVKPGGLLCGHDVHMPGVLRAVNALCPGWVKHDQEVWGWPVRDPLIVTAIPYADDRNLGRACNEIMQLLPVDGWACLLDHDAVFTTREWHRQLTAAVIQHPEGCFSAVTNRIKSVWQQTPEADRKNHDYAYHRQIGEARLQQTAIRDVTDDPQDRTPGGVVMVLSRRAWEQAGGFPEGLHYVDRLMWLALKLSGRRIYILDGLYVYHWHRGGGEPFQPGAWATRHTLPNGTVLQLKKSAAELPVYEA